MRNRHLFENDLSFVMWKFSDLPSYMLSVWIIPFFPSASARWSYLDNKSDSNSSNNRSNNDSDKKPERRVGERGPSQQRNEPKKGGHLIKHRVETERKTLNAGEGRQRNARPAWKHCL